MPGSRESVTPRIQSSEDNSACVPNILPNSSVLYISVPTHRITQLGFRSHPTGSSIPEGITTTFSSFMSEQPLYTIALTNLLRHWQDLSLLTTGIPIRSFQVEFTIFMDTSTQGWVAHMGDSQILGTWTHSDRKLHINCMELKLHHCIAMLWGHKL